MEDKSHLKKGVQYSHYTGTNRLEINSLAWLIENSQDLQEIKEYAKQIKEHVTQMSETIATLDRLNEMKQ